MRTLCLSVLLGLTLVSGSAVATDPNVQIIQLQQPRYQEDLEFWAHQDPVFLDALHVAKLGHIKSMFNVAMMAEIRGDTKTALYWYERAADRNHALAAYNLATIYYRGDGVEVDYEQAAHWMERAAELGNALAQFHMAKMYYAGRGVPQDYAMEAYWYKKAAENGNGAAAHNLAVLYQKGQGVEQNDALAQKWLEKSRQIGFDVKD